MSRGDGDNMKGQLAPDVVVACPVCGTFVNREAIGCPTCGSSPRLSPAEAEAVRKSLGEREPLVPFPSSPALPGWGRRVRAIALVPGLVAPTILAWEFYYLSVQAALHGSSGPPDYARYARQAAFVGLLALAPALIAVLPRRLPLPSAIIAFVLGMIPALALGSAILADDPTWRLGLAFSYIPALVVVRSILQGRADRPTGSVG